MSKLTAPIVLVAALVLAAVGFVTARPVTLLPGPVPSPATGVACAGTAVAPGQNIQTIVDRAPGGSTICLDAGTWRVANPINVKPGDVLSGAGRSATFLIGAGTPMVLNLQGVPQVTVEHLDVSGGQGTAACRPQCGQGIHAGIDTTISDVHVHDNTNVGIGGMHGGLITNSEIDHNGSPAFYGYSSAGIKAGTGFTVTLSTIHDNYGPGVWCDVGCGGPTSTFLVAYNVITANASSGVRYEVSNAQGLVTHNVFHGNNTAQNPHGGGVTVASSEGLTVTQNTFGGQVGGLAVSFAQGSRAPGLGRDAATYNTLSGDGLQGCGLLPTVVCRANI